jgi:uncharacterized membrane protein
VSGEFDSIFMAWHQGAVSASTIGIPLMCNVVASALLNLVSFEANRIVGAVTMTVCGNVKQVLTVLIGLIFLNNQVGYLGALGMALTMMGAFAYGYSVSRS